MSLAVLADHLASKGRNGDTMLVHMTPEEVHGLQALALAHGGSLSINPDTGLVEASWLKKLLPMIAGMALNFIAPGVGSAIGSTLFGLSGAAAGAVGTGVLVGGVTGLATGSLRQGIMAGLGAYGGASLGAGLSAAGAAGAQEAAIGSLPAEEIANRAAQSGLTEQGYRNILAEQGTKDYLAKGAMDRFTGGISALGTEAGRTAALQGVGGASGAMRAGFAAAAPAMEEQTKTQMPSLDQYTGMVRPFAFNPYGQTYTPMEPYKAASGGIVALADGGLPDSPYAAQIAAGAQAVPFATGTRATREDISGIYKDVLGRTADPGGLEFYYASQWSPEQIRNQIMQSEEYRNRPAPTPVAPAPAPGPITVSPVEAETIPGYAGEDKTFGGTDVLERVTPAPLGTSGSVTQENKTMQQVRDEYQRGGGSLGMPIIPFTPTPLTGGSKAAYDYLMGRGAYPTVPFTPTGEIMRPYAEAVLGVPVDKTRSKMIFDPATRKYVPNPDYKAPTFPNVPGTGAGGQPIIRDPAGNPYMGAAASYFAANPDVKRAYETNKTGMTPEAYAAYHWNTFGKAEGRKGYIDTVNTTPVGDGSQEANADIVPFAGGGLADVAAAAARGGNVQQYNLGGYSDGGRLLRGPGDGVSDSIPATIGNKQPARLADGEFVVPARIVSEIGNGSTEAGARKLYAMMDRVQRARAKTTGKGKVAKNTRADKYLPA